jgi:hypothetical protein
MARVGEALRGGRVAWNQRTRDRLSSPSVLRAVTFFDRIEDPIANVTLVTTPQLITRRRQNLGRVRARGLETSCARATPWA